MLYKQTPQNRERQQNVVPNCKTYFASKTEMKMEMTLGNRGSAMRGPPDPEMRKGRLCKGSPDRKPDLKKPEEFSLAASDYQAEKLRRLYSFCQATAYTIASLAFAGGPR